MELLDATRWSETGLPRTPEGLRKARKLSHPDVCKDPRATAFFAGLQAMFDAPDLDMRLFQGRIAPTYIEWSFDRVNVDLARIAVERHHAMRLDNPLWAADVTLSDTLLTTYGVGWYPLSAFTLDPRTVVWVAKRLMAQVTVAKSQGWVHGDINPLTVMLHPETHGLRLDGWWTAVPVGSRLAVSPEAPTPVRWLRGSAVDAPMSVAQTAAMVGKSAGPLEELFTSWTYSPPGPTKAFKAIDDAALHHFGPPKWHELPRP